MSSMPTTIMVVEDEPNIGALVRTYLERAGYKALWVRSGEQALSELRRHPIKLVVLDIGLPGIDGLEVCRRIGGEVPVIMLTARDEERDRVAGLEEGADDYVSKPFSPRELIARVKAVLRRVDRGRAAPRCDRAGAAGARRRRARGVGRWRRSGAHPARVRPARVSGPSRRAGGHPRPVAGAVWGFMSPGETRTVEVHVAQLRKKLGRPELIRTVRGLGYKASP